MFVITLVSGKREALSEEKEQLEGLGWEVRRRRGRYYVYRNIPGLEEIRYFWGQELFSGEPSMTERVTVTFTDVKCKSVASCLEGEVGRVILVDPLDPIHSPLFPFVVNIKARSAGLITVKAVYGHLDLELFMRVLEICQREFYREGNVVHFSSRKYIGRAKRRYLLWLDREGRFPDEQTVTMADDCKLGMARRKEEIGKLRNARGIWEALVKTEQELQQV